MNYIYTIGRGSKSYMSAQSKGSNFVIGFGTEREALHVYRNTHNMSKVEILKGDPIYTNVGFGTNVRYPKSTLFITKTNYSEEVVDSDTIYIKAFKEYKFQGKILEPNTGIVMAEHIITEDERDIVYQCDISEMLT